MIKEQDLVVGAYYSGLSSTRQISSQVAHVCGIDRDAKIVYYELFSKDGTKLLSSKITTAIFCSFACRRVKPRDQK